MYVVIILIYFRYIIKYYYRSITVIIETLQITYTMYLIHVCDTDTMYLIHVCDTDVK